MQKEIEGQNNLPQKNNKKEESNNFENYMEFLLPTCGTLKVTDEQKNILFSPIEEEAVEIRPDGMVYLPWMEYVAKLRAAFGLGWAIVPYGMPKIHGNHVVWGFYLVISAKLMGFAIGEQEYHQNNYGMSYTDACEGAKSNAIMRLCKGIGIGLELWKPSFYKNWRKKHAETYKSSKKNKKGEYPTLWKKKGGEEAFPEYISSEDQAATDDTFDHEKLDQQLQEAQEWLMTLGAGDEIIANDILQQLTKYKDFPGFKNIQELGEIKKKNNKRFYAIYKKIEKEKDDYLKKLTEKNEEVL